MTVPTKTQVTLIVMSFDEEQLNKEYFFEYLIGTDILPENVPIHFNVDLLEGSFTDFIHGKWHFISGGGELEAVGMKTIEDPDQVFLVIVDDSPHQRLAEYHAVNIQDHFKVGTMELLNVLKTKNRHLVLSTYAMRDIGGMAELQQTLLPSKETIH